MNDIPLIDRQQRDRIAEDLRTTLMVEAAAGTGKTTAMVGRMTALVREGEADIAKIAAVTFTRKAAGQLRQRFQQALEAAAKDPYMDAEKRARLEDARERLGQCFIGTIHSFCGRLLRERPVEAGVDPDFVELEEDEAALLRSEFWREYSHGLAVSESPVLETLENVGVSLPDLKSAFETLCAYPDVEVRAEVTDRPDLAAALKKVKQFLEKVEPDIPAQAPPNGRDGLQEKLLAAIRSMNAEDLATDTGIINLLSRLDCSAGRTLNRWLDADTAKDVDAEFQSIRDDVVRPALRSWHEHLHPILLDACRPAAEEFARHRRLHGQLTFQDLLMLARDMLLRFPAVRSYFRERFTHVLVDEFQDTDPIQAEVMTYLAAEETGDQSAESGWTSRRLRPGSLFIVGDPKQSIYRFRRADIVTYNRMRRLVLDSGGDVLTLSTNFRSERSVCEWANAAFAEVFPEQATDEQAARVDLAPAKPDSAPGSGVFRLTIPKPDRTRPKLEDYCIPEAERVADIIADALENGWPADGGERRSLSAGDFLIIAKGRKRLGIYARALEARGIPCLVSGGAGFGESSEVAALMPVLRAAADPDDAVSVVAFLRGPLCGISDARLLAHHTAGGSFSYCSNQPEGADDGVVDALALLRRFHELARTLPPAAAIGRIIDDLGLLALASGLDRGDIRAGNLLKALSLARSIAAEGMDFTGVVQALDELRADDEVESLSTRPDREDAVQIMNLHKAKGLEAEVVFLVDTSPRSDHAVTFHVDRSTDPPAGYFRIRVPNGPFQMRDIAMPPDWQRWEEREEAFQTAEEQRLLYVAATRAKRALIVSVSERRNSPWAHFQPFLTAEAAEPDRADAASPTADAQELAAAFQTACEQRQQALERAGQESYRREQVTRVSHSGDAPASAEPGRGASWGRVMHRLLEALMSDADLDVCAEADILLREEERPPEEADEVAMLVAGVRASDLWKRACESPERYVEAPFGVPLPAEDDGVPGALFGTVDLVFREDGGWVIVDYKSDRTQDRLEGLVERYAGQVRAYREWWQELTGEQTRAALFFIDSGHVQWIS